MEKDRRDGFARLAAGARNFSRRVEKAAKTGGNETISGKAQNQRGEVKNGGIFPYREKLKMGFWDVYFQKVTCPIPLVF